MSALRLYRGHVMHRRLRPAVHQFVYPVFFIRLRIDSLPEADGRLFSFNRFNLFSLHFADHGPRDGTPLAAWVNRLLAQEGIVADGPIWLQTFPRVLGYVFNPVSFWFCHDRQGRLQAVLAEVNNTFGEHHNYLLVAPDGGAIGEGDALEVRKVFHVSPFMAVTGSYRFRFRDHQASGGMQALIDHADAEGDLLNTALSGRAEPMTDRALLRVFVAYPWQSLGVVLRIHWQALRLWCKRIPFFHKPVPPLEETTR